MYGPNMSSKSRFPVSGMNRRFATETPATAVDTATPMSRRGIAISGAGRRLGISGMRRPVLDTPALLDAPTLTPDDSNEGLP